MAGRTGCSDMRRETPSPVSFYTWLSAGSRTREQEVARPSAKSPSRLAIVPVGIQIAASLPNNDAAFASSWPAGPGWFCNFAEPQHSTQEGSG